MASNVTLSNLRTAARRRANMENSQFVLDAELTDYINGSLQELYDLMVAKGVDYFTTSSTISTDGTTKVYSLPSNFYKLAGVDYLLNGVSTTMQPFVFADRNKYFTNNRVVRYRVVGSQIRFEPAPAAQTITIWYVPVLTKLVSDSDTFDGINGWEEFVIIDAAIKALVKQEDDPQELMILKAAQMKRIEDLAATRDQGFPEKVTDVTQFRFPYQINYGEE